MAELTSDDRLPDEKACSTLIDSILSIVRQADPPIFSFSFPTPHTERILGYSAQQWIDEQYFRRTRTSRKKPDSGCRAPVNSA
jgi:hypothetical protein